MKCPKILLIVLISVVAPNLSLINEFSFAQTSSDRKAEATRLLEQGMVILNDEQKSQEALQILQRALVIFRAIQDRSGEAKALQGIGDVYLSLNDYKKAIASLFNTQAIIGRQATKSTILSKIPQAKIIHLATHGLLDDFQGLGIPGALALAPSGNDNGLLTAS